MKTLLIILPCFFLVQTCNIQNTDKKPLVEKNTIQQEKETIDPTLRKPDSYRVRTIGFEKQVKPIFVKNCSPCHFTGGKMYERLPFDKDTTILNHHEAILKRIKNEEENTILKNFVLQNKKGLPESKPYKQL